MIAKAVLATAAAVAGVAASGWQPHAPLPEPRTEVAGAPFRGGVAVVGGYLEDGASTARADLYDPRSGSWSRLPDLPRPVNHAAAASAGGKLYVVGGYGAAGERLRAAWAYDGVRWSALRPLPSARAAAGAAVAGGRLYVVGGVGPKDLARVAFALDLRTGRWSRVDGPTPREHHAVTAARGRVYALAGRRSGLDSNVRILEVLAPATGRWSRLPPVPEARGGTGAAAVRGTIVSAGGEEPGGTAASVYAYDTDRARWRRLADLPTPRHGLAVVALAGRVYAVGGGTEPGLSVSAANESLAP